MNLRKEIISTLDRPFVQDRLYEKLKSCLIIDSEFDRSIIDHEDYFGEPHAIDEWFRGIIQSLFYNPNHRCLVLEGPIGIGKNSFFRNLFPIEINSDSNSYKYNTLIFNMEFERRKDQDLVERDDFVIFEENLKNMVDPSCDKRLCSYCSTTQKWTYPPRKNFIVINLDSIDQDKFNSIPKLQLWREIFNKFK